MVYVAMKANLCSYIAIAFLLQCEWCIPICMLGRTADDHTVWNSTKKIAAIEASIVRRYIAM